ncbi:MAG: SGNH hydrolase domain-containing protein, partial [Terracidiphilus sp.]
VMGGFPARLPSAIVALDHDYVSDNSTSWREGTCFLQRHEDGRSFGGSCLDAVQGREPEPLVFVWGDSHAADLIPGFRVLQTQSRVRLAQYTAVMCAPIIGLKERAWPDCESVNDTVLDRVKTLRPDVVVLSANWNHAEPGLDRVALADKLFETIESVRAAGVRRVVVLGSAPSWRESVPALLAGELRRNPDKPLPHSLPRSMLRAYDDTLLKAITLKAGAVYVPIFENLCDQTSCIVTTGPGWRDLMTFDQTHFTEHGSVLVTQRIWSLILGS